MSSHWGETKSNFRKMNDFPLTHLYQGPFKFYNPLHEDLLQHFWVTQWRLEELVEQQRLLIERSWGAQIEFSKIG